MSAQVTADQIVRHNDDGSCTAEWMAGHPNPAEAVEVRLYRVQLYPQVAHPGPAWRWMYTWRADGGPEREYGTGLTDAHRAVRRLFPKARIVDTWVCECVCDCAEDRATRCSLSGQFHLHPGESCPVHPDAEVTP